MDQLKLQTSLIVHRKQQHLTQADLAKRLLRTDNPLAT